MNRRLLLPLLFGVAGTLVLVLLGTWQLQRLAWKEAIIARIEARLDAPAVPVPADASAGAHQYLRVADAGRIEPGEVHVYTSRPGEGAGYRVIAPLALADGRQVLLDRGFVTVAEKEAARSLGPAGVEGALHWPQETDRFTPAPDRAGNIWFARDVAAMAGALGTEPVLVVAEQTRLAATGPGALPRPVPVTVNIPNNHLEYVITWYGLAVVWAGMTVYWLWRLGRRPDGPAEGAAESP